MKFQFTIVSLILLISNNVAAQIVENPIYVTFNPSPDHNIVTRYEGNIYKGTQATGKPVVVESLGKPTPVNNTISVTWSRFFQLKPGDYVMTVSAVGPSGKAESTASNVWHADNRTQCRDIKNFAQRVFAIFFGRCK